MTIPGSVETAAFENKNLYNSKELMDEHNLNVYDYGVRNYDPQLGRWWQVDPADEFYSPYVYCHNDPMNFLDPDGAIELEAAEYVKENLYGILYGQNGFDSNLNWKDKEQLCCNQFTFLSYKAAGYSDFLYRGVKAEGNLRTQKKWFIEKVLWTEDKNAGQTGDVIFFPGHVAMVAEAIINKQTGQTEYKLMRTRGSPDNKKNSGIYRYDSEKPDNKGNYSGVFQTAEK